VLGLSTLLAPHQSERNVYVHRDSPDAYRYAAARAKKLA
jgi:hypothetical protein